MIKTSRILLALLLCLFSAVPLAYAKDETAYDRVLKSGTLRCGYMAADPYLIKDANTGAMTGIAYDYVQELGKWLDLKIEWAEEIGFGDIAASVDSGRIDAICVPLWANPGRAKVVDFVTPITYQIVEAYVRADDTRFDNENIDKLNNENIKISCIDGEMSAIIAGEDYPRAKAACLPQSSPFSDVMMNVTNGKADVAFVTPSVVTAFNKQNTSKLKKIILTHPIRTFPESLVVARGNDDLRRMLDHTTQFLINSGKIDQIINKHAKSPDDFKLTAKPYQETE